MPIVTGDVDLATARANRLLIQSNVPGGNNLSLAGATVQLDDMLRPVSNQTINGPCVLVNQYSHVRTVEMLGGGLAYFDFVTVVGKDKFRLPTPEAAAKYVLDSSIFTWILDGEFLTSGLQAGRHKVLAVSGTDVTVSGPALDSRVNVAKWFDHSVAIPAVKTGATTLAFQNHPTDFRAGDHILISDGPTDGNNNFDEWNRVRAVRKTATGGRYIELVRPLVRSFTHPIVARMAPMSGVKFASMTIIPATGSVDVDTALIESVTNFVLENVTLTGVLSIPDSDDVTLINCAIDNLAINSTRRFRAYNCVIKNFLFEEDCDDMLFVGCTFGSGDPVQAVIGCQGGNCTRLTLLNCIVDHAPGGLGIAVTTDDLVIDRLTIRNSNAGTVSYFHCNRARISHVVTDTRLWFQIGTGYTLIDIAGPVTLGQTGQSSQGTALDCTNATIQAGDWVNLAPAGVIDIGGGDVEIG